MSRWLRGKKVLARLDGKSFKREYTARVNILKMYKRPSASHSHTIANSVPIFMYANYVFLLCISRGVVFKFVVDTGKLEKKVVSLLDGGDNQRLVTVCCMLKHDMLASGYSDGRVSVLVLNSRNYQNSSLGYFDDSHSSAVTAITTWKTVVVSGSFGQVCIWYCF